ncbi:MAG TPA: hypothetical protein VF607_11980 [Verrucomicrobiae bacterium]
MKARITFLGIAVFWAVMNFFLWNREYGVRGGDTPVPFALVWRKILTAPDASSLSVYQNHERMGYAEFSTSIGQQMATLDEDKVPPEGLLKHAGYQVHLNGNVAMGDFTNRLKFDGRVMFSNVRDWQEFYLRVTSRQAVLDLHSVATNQTVHIKLVSDGFKLERDFTFTEMQNPNTLVHALTGNLGDLFLGTIDLPDFSMPAGGQKVVWDARRTRVKVGREYLPVYRLESSVLGHPVTVDVSTIGEVLSVDLPGGITARIDDWNKP